MQDVLNKIQMNIKYNILPLFAAVSLLTACSDDDIDRVYTVGEADNAIVLRAGVNEGGAGVETRSRDGNHANHKAFTSGTKIALRIDGTWTDHSPETISQQTIATVGDVAANTNDRHNQLSGYNPVRYWDDYGTADPANVGTPENPKGRETGLTIYGIGVDGVTTAPNMEANDSWTNFSWSVCSSDEANGTATPKVIDQATNGWANYDLLTSNNIHVEETNMDYDGTYKFDDYLSDKNNDTNKSSNILEFTHAMTKITVQLTAGEGFPITDGKAHFENDPTVTLEGFYYKGSVNVEDKISTHSNDVDKANIKMHLNEGGAAHTATFDALVFPGNAFENTDPILTFTADGNTLHVTAAKLNEAIEAAITNKENTKYPGTNKTLLQAWNYLLKITVKKTDLDITATILDWKTVVAEEEEPKINVTEVYGHEGSAFAQNFDFFRSTNKASGYSKDAWVEHKETSGTHTYTFHDQLYWPNHQTHYFFRGVYPRVQTESQAGWILASNVSSSTSSATTIAVENSKYQEGTYPSDLALGWPDAAAGWPTSNTESDFDETCKVHTDKEGICATEGQIRMNFKYVMSKVQFSLKSSGTEGENKVDLSNVVVEIIDGYQSGKIRLSDGKHENFVADDKRDYVLNKLASPETDYNVTTLDAIVPQTLGNDVKIRITVRDVSKNVLDVYEAQLNKIKDSSSAEITEWLPGNYYKYYLDINKTAINVTATLTDWVEVTAKDEVWF